MSISQKPREIFATTSKLSRFRVFWGLGSRLLVSGLQTTPVPGLPSYSSKRAHVGPWVFGLYRGGVLPRKKKDNVVSEKAPFLSRKPQFISLAHKSKESLGSKTL